MLSDHQRDIIKATVPLLEIGGETLTTHFYTLLLAEHPELRPLFNQAHQASGAQPRALANGVLTYARHIDQLQALGPLAARIVNKHVALQILPEHYPLVGGCLLRSIREVLGADVATDGVIDAWAAAYQQLAELLIGAEAARYEAIAAAEGGWRGARGFQVTRKVVESDEITSFYLVPVDGEALMDFKPGQYLGLKLNIQGSETRRNYSLSAAPNGRDYRISVKRESGGVASGFLHDRVEVGTRLEVFAPAGDFTLGDSAKPLVLISAGVGITPTLAMAQAALGLGQRPVLFIHYARNAQVHGFKEQIADWSARHGQFSHRTVYETTAPLEDRQPDATGRATLAQLRDWLPGDRDVDAYFLGPQPFMSFIKRALLEIGVPQGQTHYEFFGPAQTLNT